MYKILILLVIVSGFFSCVTNKNSDLAKQNITQLKKCGLAVKLITQEKQIEQLFDQGQEHSAELIKQRTQSFNKKIRDQLQQFYDFSDVYYFFSSDREVVRSSNYREVLYDNQMKKISKNVCPEFSILEFGNIRQDQNKNYSNSWTIKDRNFRALPSPFPYTKKTFDCFMTKEGRSEIACLNKKLHRYYSKVTNTH